MRLWCRRGHAVSCLALHDCEVLELPGKGKEGQVCLAGLAGSSAARHRVPESRAGPEALQHAPVPCVNAVLPDGQHDAGRGEKHPGPVGEASHEAAGQHGGESHEYDGVVGDVEPVEDGKEDRVARGPDRRLDGVERCKLRHAPPEEPLGVGKLEGLGGVGRHHVDHQAEQH